MQYELQKMILVPVTVLNDERFKKYKGGTKLVYIWLIKLHNQLANAEGWIQVSNKTISDETGLSEDAIRYAKEQLVKDELIEVRNSVFEPTVATRHTKWVRVKGWQEFLKASINQLGLVRSLVPGGYCA
jgi:hypothetical protein